MKELSEDETPICLVTVRHQKLRKLFMKDFIHLSYFSICVKYQYCASWLGINATVTDFRRILCKVKIMLPFGTLATTPNPYEKNGDRTLKRMSKDETSIV